MNSLFNYELDEQKIRLTLHDAELDYSDASWMEFDNEYPAELSKPNKLSAINLPKISLNINRNVLVPIFFIVALGGVSAIMFKFIDFKANKPVEAERALESNATNLQAEKKEIPPPVKKEIPKVVNVIPTEIKKDTILANTNFVVPTATFAAQRTDVAKAQFTEPIVQRNYTPTNIVADTTQKSDNAILSDNKTPVHTIYYKKRRKKLVVEQVETIKAPSLLSAQAAPNEEEPELKIKQN